MNIYQQEILDRYQNPENQGIPESYNANSESSNLSCGDSITVYMDIKDEKINNIKYVGEGCVISLATADILADELKSMKTEDVIKMDWEDLTEILGITLTSSRIKCALLSLNAIKKAIKDNKAL